MMILETTVAINKDNTFSVPLPVRKEIKIRFIAPGYFPVSKQFKVSLNSKTGRITVPMTKMEMNATLRTTLNFHGDLAILLPKSTNDFTYRELANQYYHRVIEQ